MLHITIDICPDLYLCLIAIGKNQERLHVHRRGSAWGLAGLVKGMGIGSLKKFGILERIKEATEDQVCPQTFVQPLFALEVCLSCSSFLLTSVKSTTDLLCTHLLHHLHDTV